MKNHSTNIKVRVIAVYRILLRGRTVTARDILRELKENYGIVVDMKTIYSDIAAVDRFVPVKVTTGFRGGYSLWDVLGGVEDGTE